MDNSTLAIFIHELRNQCLYTEISFNVFNSSFEQKNPTGIFFSSQSTLLAASQIACILWPTSSRSRKRGEALRGLLNLDEKHPLNNNQVKGLWDKGDEKLEKWISGTKGLNVVFDHLGPIDQIDANNFSEKNIYRLYDTKTSVYLYRGNGYNMQAIANAIADIYTRVTAVHQKMFPDHYKKVEEQKLEAANEKASKKPAKKTTKKPAKKTVKKPKEKAQAKKKAPAKKKK